MNRLAICVPGMTWHSLGACSACCCWSVISDNSLLLFSSTWIYQNDSGTKEKEKLETMRLKVSVCCWHLAENAEVLWLLFRWNESQEFWAEFHFGRLEKEKNLGYRRRVKVFCSTTWRLTCVGVRNVLQRCLLSLGRNKSRKENRNSTRLRTGRNQFDEAKKNLKCSKLKLELKSARKVSCLNKFALSSVVLRIGSYHRGRR